MAHDYRRAVVRAAVQPVAPRVVRGVRLAVALPLAPLFAADNLAGEGVLHKQVRAHATAPQALPVQRSCLRRNDAG